VSNIESCSLRLLKCFSGGLFSHPFALGTSASDISSNFVSKFTCKPCLIYFLQILDHEQEVASTMGKAHAVIPAFTFYRDRTGDEEEKQGKRGEKIKQNSFGTCKF